jgi:formylglycine-generating enzyme required for sulfatase activity
LFDIHGNLFEWCHDPYGDYFVEATGEETTGPAQDSYRVSRGGGWSLGAAYCRSASRETFLPTSRGDCLGFRVATVPFSRASEAGSQAANDAGSEGREAE